MPTAEILDYLVKDLKNRRAKAKLAGKLRHSTGRSILEMHIRVLRNFGRIALTISPFSAALSTDIPHLKDITKDYRRQIGLPYAAFNGQEHFRAIPLHIAAAWLAFIIDEFNSDEFKIWQAYWIILRKYQKRKHHHKFPTISTWHRVTKSIHQHQDSAYYFHQGKRKQNHDFMVATYTQTMKETLGYLPSQEQVQKVTNPAGGLNRKNVVIKYLQHLYAVIAMTTGARRSEIAYLRLSDFEEHSDEVSGFTSYIHKTNAGLPTVRSISGFSHQMVKACANLGFRDRRENNVYLFSASYNPCEPLRDLGTRAKYFNESYQTFLQNIPDKLSQSFRNELPKVSTHQARHFFA